MKTMRAVYRVHSHAQPHAIWSLCARTGAEAFGREPSDELLPQTLAANFELESVMGSVGVERRIPGGFEAGPFSDGLDALLFLRGELDLAGAPKVSRAASDLRAAPGSRVVLDCSELVFIDASGIHTILSACDELASHGVQVIVRSPQPAVRRALELCGLEGWLESLVEVATEDEDLARARVSAAAPRY